MGSFSPEESSKQTDHYPLLMERVESHIDQEHIIDITRHDDTSSSSSQGEQPSGVNLEQNENRPSSGTQAPINQTASSNRLNSRSSSFMRRNDGDIKQDLSHSGQGSSHGNPTDSTPYTAISVTHASNEANNHITESATTNSQIAGTISTKLNGLVDHFKMALDCFFAMWFVVGNVWIFEGHSSPSDAPKLYRLCIVFLTFSCIRYAMPFILCTTICCCLPCIICILGFREDFSQTRGASMESINALPTYKFKNKKTGNVNDQDHSGGEGVLAGGTAKEREISGEDAVCCICLAKYADNDELRELPCIHVFYVECVDKWLKINSSCPLCKSEVVRSALPPLARDSN